MRWQAKRRRGGKIKEKRSDIGSPTKKAEKAVSGRRGLEVVKPQGEERWR